MTDRISRVHRSWNMSRIRGADTRPEIIVRSLIHRLGARFRLHRSDLPGKPDIVLSRYHLVVLVHGCFWHRHPGCKFAYNPKTRTTFWNEKFATNVKRDKQVRHALKRLGWNVMIVWECETRDSKSLTSRLSDALTQNRPRD